MGGNKASLPNTYSKPVKKGQHVCRMVLGVIPGNLVLGMDIVLYAYYIVVYSP